MQIPKGQYRTVPERESSPMAYVIGGGPASFVTEEVYRAKGYQPPFETLPTEDEYNA